MEMYLWLMFRESQLMNYKDEWTQARISQSLMSAILRLGPKRTPRYRKRSEFQSTISKGICPESRKTSLPSPTALDRTKALAPVWRRNFNNTGTMLTPCKADFK